MWLATNIPDMLRTRFAKKIVKVTIGMFDDRCKIIGRLNYTKQACKLVTFEWQLSHKLHWSRKLWLQWKIVDRSHHSQSILSHRRYIAQKNVTEFRFSQTLKYTNFGFRISSYTECSIYMRTRVAIEAGTNIVSHCARLTMNDAATTKCIQ